MYTICRPLSAHASGTVQVSHIDVSKESPCGHGTVICFSVYCGQNAHFGELVDDEPADGIVQNQLWVDTLADEHKDQVYMRFTYASARVQLWRCRNLPWILVMMPLAYLSEVTDSEGNIAVIMHIVISLLLEISGACNGSALKAHHNVSPTAVAGPCMSL